MRLAKFIAGCGVCSRRRAEELIAAGRIHVDDQQILSPAVNVTLQQKITLDSTVLSYNQAVRLWLYYKPIGLITTHSDPEKRPTIFEALAKSLPRVVSVGRLDINSEGLLLLTNSGELARFFESPKNKFERIYKVRAFGNNKKIETDRPKKIFVDNVRYNVKSIRRLPSSGGLNHWYEVIITEGKNREIRRIFDHFGLKVNKLIRIGFAEYSLGNMAPGEYKEVEMNENYLRKISGQDNTNRPTK